GAVSAFTRGFALSPDASVLVYSARTADGRYRLFRRPLADPRGDAIAGTEDGMYPFFSPNGQDIGFFAAGELKTVPLAGGPVHTIAKAPGSYPRGSWNTAGQILLSVGNAAGAGILQVPALGGALVKLPIDGNAYAPQWLPDGRHFLFIEIYDPAGHA